MLMLFVHFSILAFMCSVIGYVVPGILLYEDVLNWYARLLGRLPEWLGKPLGLCAVCFTGQIALWSSVIYAINTGANLIYIAYTVCLAIYLVKKMN